MENLIFIKLGGSLITKKVPYTLNWQKIKEIVKEIVQLRRKYKFKLLLGNGAGSFAHVSAKNYKTRMGYINEKSKIGHCKVEDDASTLNRILVKELIQVGEKAISVQPSAFITTSNGKIKSFSLEPIKNYLRNDLVPVVFGDVVSDEKRGCAILSTEALFKFLAKFLRPKKIILMSDVEGVYDFNKKIIPEINKRNFPKIQKYLKGTEKIDVTGGMAQKVKEAMEMAKEKIEVFIISGKKGNLGKLLMEEKVGTKIVF